jgi:hypothetical protein
MFELFADGTRAPRISPKIEAVVGAGGVCGKPDCCGDTRSAQPATHKTQSHTTLCVSANRPTILLTLPNLEPLHSPTELWSWFLATTVAASRKPTRLLDHGPRFQASDTVMHLPPLRYTEIKALKKLWYGEHLERDLVIATD